MMTATQTITTDTTLLFLADRQRRRVLQHLIEVDGPVPINQLPATVIRGAPSREERETLRARFMQQLHHVHLPILLDAGLLQHDSSNGTIRHTSNDVIEAILELCSS